MRTRLLAMGFVEEGEFFLNFEIRLRIKVVDDTHLIAYVHDGDNIVEEELKISELEDAILDGRYGEY